MKSMIWETLMIITTEWGSGPENLKKSLILFFLFNSFSFYKWGLLSHPPKFLYRSKYVDMIFFLVLLYFSFIKALILYYSFIYKISSFEKPPSRTYFWNVLWEYFKIIHIFLGMTNNGYYENFFLE